MRLQERVEKLQKILEKIDRSKKLLYEDIREICAESRMSYFLVCSALLDKGIVFENVKEGKVRIIGEMIENRESLEKIVKYLGIRKSTVLRYAYEAGYIKKR